MESTTIALSHRRPFTGDGIIVQGLRKAYGELIAVQGIDLAIPPGETVALLGPNGAGKSTTIDMLLGLTRPDGGRLSIFGMSPDEAVQHGAVGVMLQTGALIRDLTVRELVAMVAALYPRPLPVDDTLSLASIGDLAGRRTHKLSGGETQRVRYALAIAGDPDLLVLDEPTVALDVEARHAFWTTTRAFAGTGRTVVFATHYLEEADSYADRIVVLAQGRIVADGPATEIKARARRRTIEATLPGVTLRHLEALPGVARGARRGDAVTLSCSDSDAAIRALLAAHPEARDIEVRGGGLEEAFLELVKANDQTTTTDTNTHREPPR